MRSTIGELSLQGQLSGDGRLQTVFLHVTKACNLRCRYCYFSAARALPDEMSSEEIALMWPALVQLAPEKLVVTGGEPTLRADLAELFRSLRNTDHEHRIRRCLNTNGHLVTAALVGELVGCVDEVRISIDALRERNDQLRGSGNFDAAVRAIELFHSAGFEPKALVTVTSESIVDLEDLLAFLVDRNVTRVNVNAFRPIGRGAAHPDWRVNPDDVETAIQRVLGKSGNEHSRLQHFQDVREQSSCGVGQFINIMPNGDVFPCHVLTMPEFRCGNVRHESLTDICDRNGLLRRLAQVNFHDFVRHDARLGSLTRANGCLGEVYAGTRALPIWSELLSH